MTRTLIASPIVDASADPRVFVPGPAAYPPLDPVANVDRALLGGTSLHAENEATLTADPIINKTLSEVAA